MPEARILYIIGFMGSGKSTTGKKLASMLGWTFKDLDMEIEERTGMKIHEIFSLYGEAYFRDLESRVLRSMPAVSDTVISTGGGTPCHGGNMEYMKASGLTLYLSLTPAQLKSRLSRSGDKRPLIKNVDEESILSFIENKLAEREKWYSRADMVIDGFRTRTSSVLSLVKSRLDTGK